MHHDDLFTSALTFTKSCHMTSNVDIQDTYQKKFSNFTAAVENKHVDEGEWPK